MQAMLVQGTAFQRGKATERPAVPLGTSCPLPNQGGGQGVITLGEAHWTPPAGRWLAAPQAARGEHVP